MVIKNAMIAGILALLAIGIIIGSVVIHMSEKNSHESANPEHTKTALFAGGCFWCVESDLEKIPSVVSAVSGYAGGTTPNPTYENYASLGYREVVEVTYDPARTSYKELAQYLLRHIDPTDGGGSFHDRGEQYAPALYYETEAEKSDAEAAVKEVEDLHVFNAPLAVKILPRPKFYPAETYHQDYSQKNPVKYEYFRFASGRDAFVRAHWGSAVSDSASAREAELRERLTPLQYQVTQEGATEPAFQNAYWNNEEAGLYVDVVSGEPLFTSLDKYDSGTGWPSFTKPISEDAIATRTDRSFLGERTEVHSRGANSHLGHVFTDGPQEKGGLRYCMNSAALEFIPVADLEKRGYTEEVKFFQ